MTDAIDRVLPFGLTALAVVLCLLAVLWVFGSRPVSRLSSAELIAAVALGVVIGLALLSPTISGAGGIVAILGLTLLLSGIRLIHMWNAIPLASCDAVLVFHRGSFLPEALAKAGITERTIVAAVWAQGYRALGEVSTIFLEADGTITIIPRPKSQPRPILRVVSTNTSSDD